MAQDLFLPSSHFLRRHLFLVSGEEPCDRHPRQEDEHRLAVLTRSMARHLLLDDAEVDQEMPEKAEGYLERGILGSTKEASSALHDLKCVFDPASARQQLQAANFQHLKRLQSMNQNSNSRQSKNRGCGRGNGCPLDLPPSAWPPLLKPPPPLPHHRRAMLLGTSGGRKESIGTGVFLPRVVAAKFVPRKKSIHYKKRQASTLNLSLNSDDAAAAADAPVAAAQETELPQEWTY
ncbi:uncharacterized protein LOC122039015 isoform X2 [Zingiber officinale]|uniref:uncharacterized protein LOC122039015 isoform X2 n=1 Tax=Zingiber officinale TaxID=94328 RepID=UPI001C4C6B82|nr:uncharacterized protein LOC122039015 isoform X2 [Zingiber officinale]